MNVSYGLIVAALAAVLLPRHGLADNAAAPDDKQSAGQLQEVIVTAEKRSELLSKAPIAVSALTPNQLASAGVQSVEDLTTQVPNLEIGNNNFLGNAVVLTIRGLTSNFFDYLGDPAVALYVDGVYVPRTEGLSTGFFDLERVEVLRGPQGTLYGRNTIAGAVNVITAPPEHKFDAAADFSLGNYNDVEAHGMINVPLGSTLAVRAAVMSHRNNGYFDTHGSTARNYGMADDFGGRLSALWTPSDDLTWRLTAEDFQNRGTFGAWIELGPNGRPAEGMSVYDQPINPFPEPSLNISNFSVRSRIDWNITPSLSLAYIAGYQSLRDKYVGGSTNPPGPDGTPQLVNAFFGDFANSNYMHEVNFNYDGRRLKNVAGISYNHERSNDNPTYYLLAIPALIRGSLGNQLTQTAYGIFDQATYNITGSLRVEAGVRYSHDEKHNGDDLVVFCGASTPQAVLSDFPPSENVGVGANNPPAGCALLNFSGQGSWSGTTWKAGLDHDFGKDTLGYLSVATGFKEGSINEASPPLPYKPQKAINYEMGLKTRLLDGRLRMSGAAFYENITDLQVSQLYTFGVVTTNAGSANIHGVELEAHWLPTGSDHLDGFVNWLSATFTDYKNAVDVLSNLSYSTLDGNYLPKAPKFSVRLRYAHDFDLGNGAILTPAVDSYYQTTTYLREFNLPIDRVPGYTRTGADLTYTDPAGRWTAELFAHNLEGTALRNLAYILNGRYYGIYDAPRTYGARVSYKY